MHDTAKLPLLTVDTSSVPGLVWAFSALPGQPAVPLAPPEILTALAKPGGWVWLHVDLVDQRAPNWLTHHCALPESARAILEAHEEAIALGHDDGVVHGVFIDFHRELAGQSLAVGTVFFALTDRLLVTGRRHPLATVPMIRQALEEGALFADAFDLFGAIVFAFCRNASARLGAAAGELDAVEDHLVSERITNERLRLKTVRRLAVSIHRPVASLVALFQDDERERWTIPASAHAMLKRLTLRLEALDREVVATNDRARLLQEELAAELAEESNRSLRALAVMSALLLPGSLIVGIFGMNTGGLPLSDTPVGFVVALGIGAGATAFFYWALLRAGASLRF
jgi:zinc transporter